MAVTIEKIGQSFKLGEGPHWDAETQNLYFVDIFGGSINKYNPTTKKHTKAIIGNNVTFIIPIQSAPNKFAISINRQLAIATWDGESETISNLETVAVIEDEEGKRENRFNDAKADHTGRLWLGTMGPESAPGVVAGDVGSLYSFGNGGFKKHFDGVYISNGIAFDRDRRKMYYIDSVKMAVEEFDYDEEKVEISNRRTIFTFKTHNVPGLPDGQTIDTDGNLWVAVFNGGRVIQIDPRKPETLLRTINLPALQITSVAFGGRNLDELYVTSARNEYEGKVLSADDGHGYTYVVRGLGVKGFPGEKVKLDV